MSFMQSDPKIYNTMIIKGEAAKCQKEDIMGRLAQVEAMGFKWDPILSKLINMGERYLTYQTPWLHQGPDAYKMCGKDHGVVFNNFGFIPEGCQRCWKVCLGVKDFANTVKLEEYQSTCGMPSKCGMEVRDYTPKHWGGYFYNNSFDEGMDCYEKVTKDLDDHIGSDNYGAILKRGCTEMEMIKGPSPMWHMTDADREIYDIISEYVTVQSSRSPQSHLVRANVKMKWMLWAHANGDMSYLPFNGGEKLFPGYVTYHDREREDVKAEIAAAQGAVRGVPPEKTIEFLGAAGDFANKNGLDMNALGHAFGHFSPSPNPYTAQLVENIPEGLKGEHDKE